MDTKLRGKIALITGAGKRRGIGFGIAQALAAEGCHLVLADLPVQDNHGGLTTGSLAEMEELAAEIRTTYGVEVLCVGLDISSLDSCLAAATAVKDRFGGLQVLVNNAGAAIGAGRGIHQYDEAAWIRTIDININGAFRMCRAMVPLMDQGGSIINTASRAGKFPALGNGCYSVAKAGVIMMSKVMAKELASAKIRVNAVCPGQIMTDMEAYRFAKEAEFFGGTAQDRIEEMCKSIPLGYIGAPADVANLVVFLAGDSSSYMTGQAINVTGGQLMEL